MMLEVSLRKNPEYRETKEDLPRYFFEVNLDNVVPSGGASNIAVYWRPNPERHPILKEIYSCEIAGTVLEKGNLSALKKILPDFIEGLVNYKTLPYYYINIFGEIRTPVYLVEKKLQVRFSDGAYFSGLDISSIYKKIIGHFISTRRIKQEEEIELGLLYWKELRLFPFGFSFVDFNEKIFIPIFYKVDGEINLNYDVIGQPSRILPLENIFDLWQEIASSLVTSGIISSLYELRIEGLVKELWERIRSLVNPLDSVLSFYKDGQKIILSIFQTKTKELFCLQEQVRLRLSFGQDIQDLRERLAKGLIKARKIRDVSELVLERMRR
ncbi:MAG: hypothetical protein NC834_02005 [Candidatus Omnitrophica bacterium]|nr:hypothetical protein [Candidatus Omnitrophota bacterium]